MSGRRTDERSWQPRRVFISLCEPIAMNWPHQQSPYQILMIDMRASVDTVTNACKRLIVAVHPDRDSSQEALIKFKLIRDAYELLTDSGRRNEYDNMARPNSGTVSVSSFHDFDVSVRDGKTRRTRDKAMENASWKHASLLIEYLKAHAALCGKHEYLWEQMESEGICDLESLKRAYPRISGSPIVYPAGSLPNLIPTQYCKAIGNGISSKLREKSPGSERPMPL